MCQAAIAKPLLAAGLSHNNIKNEQQKSSPRAASKRAKQARKRNR
jgi:hypothetical protein